ncbi:MAG: hypothetical protein ACTSPI_01325 [Candidatus Heimdallarchaeaceae archaeon]
MEKVVRKKDPSITRKNIHVATFKRVEEFLKAQIEPVFPSEIVNQLSVDYNSLKIALEMLSIKRETDGRISLEGGENV